MAAFISLKDKKTVISQIRKDKSLSLTRREVLAELAWCRNQFNGLCCPCIQTLSDRVGVKPKTIERAVIYLEKIGHLVVDRTRGHVNKYIVAPIEWMISKRRDEETLQNDVATEEQDEKNLQTDVATDEQNVSTDRQNVCRKKKISSSNSHRENLILRQETNCPENWTEIATSAVFEDLPAVALWRQQADMGQGTMIYLLGETFDGRIVRMQFKCDYFNQILKNKAVIGRWAPYNVCAAFNAGLIDYEQYLALKRFVCKFKENEPSY